MRAVFYLGAGWPQWKPLGIPGSHLPLKRGSWLTEIYFFLEYFRYIIFYSAPEISVLIYAEAENRFMLDVRQCLQLLRA